MLDFLFLDVEGSDTYQKAIEYEEEGVDIIVSHQPRYTILDWHPIYGYIGRPTLLKKVKA